MEDLKRMLLVLFADHALSPLNLVHISMGKFRFHLKSPYGNMESCKQNVTRGEL